jgi:hypothetical protein
MAFLASQLTERNNSYFNFGLALEAINHEKRTQ